MPTSTSHAFLSRAMHLRRTSTAVNVMSNPAFRSDRVVLADRPPVLPPWSADDNGNSLRLSVYGTSGSSSATDMSPEGEGGMRLNNNRTKNTGLAHHHEPETKFGRRHQMASRALRRWRRSASMGDSRGPDTAGFPSPVSSQNRNHAGGTRTHHSDHRQERNHQQQVSLQPVCPSISDWIQRTEAEDFLGNRVQLVQNIDNGSTRVNQYFFETFCSSSSSTEAGRHHRQHVDGGGSCVGIDSTHYESVCYDTHTLVYGLVADYSRSGDGWTFIKVRSGCNCGLIDRRSIGVGGNVAGLGMTSARPRGRGRNNRR